MVLCYYVVKCFISSSLGWEPGKVIQISTPLSFECLWAISVVGLHPFQQSLWSLQSSCHHQCFIILSLTVDVFLYFSIPMDVFIYFAVALDVFIYFAITLDVFMYFANGQYQTSQGSTPISRICKASNFQPNAPNVGLPSINLGPTVFLHYQTTKVEHILLCCVASFFKKWKAFSIIKVKKNTNGLFPSGPPQDHISSILALDPGG